MKFNLLKKRGQNYFFPKPRLLKKIILTPFFCEGLAVTGILFIVAIVFTWPLAKHLTRAIPAGSEPVSVALFQLFSAEWTGQALDQGKSYWDAPFFYPYQGAFAWCEPQPFFCVVVWLIAKLTGYVFAYNAMVLWYLVAFGLAGYAASRMLTNDRLAALWSGVWLTAGAYALQQICAPALLAACFPCACILFGFLYTKDGKRRFFWFAFVCYALTWMTCKQAVLFLTIILPFAMLPCLNFSSFSRKNTILGCCIRISLAVFALSLLVIPYSLRQLSYVRFMGFQRALDSVNAALRLKDLFLPAKGHWLVTHILGWGNQPGYYSWDTGVSAVLAIAAALLFGMAKLRDASRYQKKIIAGLLCVVMVSLFLGFGTKASITAGGKHLSLYGLFFSILPGFDLVRTPARFGLYVIFGVAVLAAAALAYIRSRMQKKTVKIAVTAFFFALIFVEMWTPPVPLVYPDDFLRGHEGAINWLRDKAVKQPLLELPMSAGLAPSDMISEAGAMMRMLRHKNPIVNGYASFFPVPFQQLKRALLVDPKGLGRRYLDAYRVRYVLVHEDLVPDGKKSDLKEALGGVKMYEDSAHSLYELPEKKRTGDFKQFFYQSVLFRKAPQKDKLYLLPLARPPDEAVFVAPQPDWRMAISWPDTRGVLHTNEFRMRGSVIIESQKKRLFIQVLRSPKDGFGGEAKFISWEKGEELLRRNKLNEGHYEQ